MVNSLTVSVPASGKKRLILDLREVNKHLWKERIKYEDIKVALAFLEKGFYMIKFDITSAFHFISMADYHRDFLGFSWVDDAGNTVYYKCLVMPFGLCSASHVISKICRPLVNKCRGEGKMVNMHRVLLPHRVLEKKKYMGQSIKSDIWSLDAFQTLLNVFGFLSMF